MAILGKFVTLFVVPTPVPISAIQFFRSASNIASNVDHNRVVEIDRIIPFSHRLTNVFRTACYSFFDLNPLSPINVLGHLLNSEEVSGISKWKVRQTGEALLLHRDTYGVDGDVRVFVQQNTDIMNGPTNSSTLTGGVQKHLGMGVQMKYFGHYIRVFEYMVNQPAALIIERKGSENDEDYRAMLIDLPLNVYNNNEIKIEEENYVLKITVPKLKPRWINRVTIDWKRKV